MRFSSSTTVLVVALTTTCSFFFSPVNGSGLAETVSSNSFLQSLTTALQQEDLFTALDTNFTNTTLLGPTDAAFSALTNTDYGVYFSSSNSAASSWWHGHLSTLLLFHLVHEQLNVSQIFDGVRANLTTYAAGGDSLNITIHQDTKTLQDVGATIQTADLVADNNNMLQIIDHVLIPPNMSRTLWQNVELVNIPQLVGKKAPFNQEGYSIHSFLLNETGLDQTLYSSFNKNGTTVFIPPNTVYLEFFQRFVLGALLAPGNTYYTTQYLQYQALSYNVYLSDIPDGAEMHMPSLLGPSLWLTNRNNSLYFNGAHVFAPDQLAKNGVAHMVSAFFPAPTTRDLLNYTTLATSHQFGELFGILLQQNYSIGEVGASLMNASSTIGSATLFAPVDMAIFAKLDSPTLLRLLDPTWHLHLRVLLLNHMTVGTITAADLLQKAPFALTMANGQTVPITKSTNEAGQEEVMFGGANVFLTDLIGLDGIFHGVDQLILPVELTRSLLDVIEQDTDLTKLSQYITQFGLATNVSETSPITILAPVNAAWDSPNIVESVLGDIVKGQIIQQLWTSDELVDGTLLQATNGQVLKVTRPNGNNDGDIFIDGAKIVSRDILGVNGVIHKLETVVIDFNTAIPPPVVAPTQQPFTSFPTPTLAAPTPPTSVIVTGVATNGSACVARSAGSSSNGCAPSSTNITVQHIRPVHNESTSTSAAMSLSLCQTSALVMTVLSALLAVVLV